MAASQHNNQNRNNNPNDNPNQVPPQGTVPRGSTVFTQREYQCTIDDSTRFDLSKHFFLQTREIWHIPRFKADEWARCITKDTAEAVKALQKKTYIPYCYKEDPEFNKGGSYEDYRHVWWTTLLTVHSIDKHGNFIYGCCVRTCMSTSRYVPSEKAPRGRKITDPHFIPPKHGSPGRFCKIHFMNLRYDVITLGAPPDAREYGDLRPTYEWWRQHMESFQDVLYFMKYGRQWNGTSIGRRITNKQGLVRSEDGRYIPVWVWTDDAIRAFMQAYKSQVHRPSGSRRPSFTNEATTVLHAANAALARSNQLLNAPNVPVHEMANLSSPHSQQSHQSHQSQHSVLTEEMAPPTQVNTNPNISTQSVQSTPPPVSRKKVHFDLSQNVVHQQIQHQSKSRPEHLSSHDHGTSHGHSDHRGASTHSSKAKSPPPLLSSQQSTRSSPPAPPPAPISSSQMVTHSIQPRSHQEDQRQRQQWQQQQRREKEIQGQHNPPNPHRFEWVRNESDGTPVYLTHKKPGASRYECYLDANGNFLELTKQGWAHKEEDRRKEAEWAEFQRQQFQSSSRSRKRRSQNPSGGSHNNPRNYNDNNRNSYGGGKSSSRPGSGSGSRYGYGATGGLNDEQKEKRRNEEIMQNEQIWLTPQQRVDIDEYSGRNCMTPAAEHQLRIEMSRFNRIMSKSEVEWSWKPQAPGLYGYPPDDAAAALLRLDLDEKQDLDADARQKLYQFYDMGYGRGPKATGAADNHLGRGRTILGFCPVFIPLPPYKGNIDPDSPCRVCYNVGHWRQRCFITPAVLAFLREMGRLYEGILADAWKAKMDARDQKRKKKSAPPLHPPSYPKKSAPPPNPPSYPPSTHISRPSQTDDRTYKQSVTQVSHQDYRFSPTHPTSISSHPPPPVSQQSSGGGPYPSRPVSSYSSTMPSGASQGVNRIPPPAYSQQPQSFPPKNWRPSPPSMTESKQPPSRPTVPPMSRWTQYQLSHPQQSQGSTPVPPPTHSQSPPIVNNQSSRPSIGAHGQQQSLPSQAPPSRPNPVAQSASPSGTGNAISAADAVPSGDFEVDEQLQRDIDLLQVAGTWESQDTIHSMIQIWSQEIEFPVEITTRFIYPAVSGIRDMYVEVLLERFKEDTSNKDFIGYHVRRLAQSGDAFWLAVDTITEGSIDAFVAKRKIKNLETGLMEQTTIGVIRISLRQLKEFTQLIPVAEVGLVGLSDEQVQKLPPGDLTILKFREFCNLPMDNEVKRLMRAKFGTSTRRVNDKLHRTKIRYYVPLTIFNHQGRDGGVEQFCSDMYSRYCTPASLEVIRTRGPDNRPKPGCKVLISLNCLQSSATLKEQWERDPTILRIRGLSGTSYRLTRWNTERRTRVAVWGKDLLAARNKKYTTTKITLGNSYSWRTLEMTDNSNRLGPTLMPDPDVEDLQRKQEYYQQIQQAKVTVLSGYLTGANSDVIAEGMEQLHRLVEDEDKEDEVMDNDEQDDPSVEREPIEVLAHDVALVTESPAAQRNQQQQQSSGAQSQDSLQQQPPSSRAGTAPHSQSISLPDAAGASPLHGSQQSNVSNQSDHSNNPPDSPIGQVDSNFAYRLQSDNKQLTVALEQSQAQNRMMQKQMQDIQQQMHQFRKVAEQQQARYAQELDRLNQRSNDSTLHNQLQANEVKVSVLTELLQQMPIGEGRKALLALREQYPSLQGTPVAANEGKELENIIAAAMASRLLGGTVPPQQISTVSALNPNAASFTNTTILEEIREDDEEGDGTGESNESESDEMTITEDQVDAQANNDENDAVEPDQPQTNEEEERKLSDNEKPTTPVRGGTFDKKRPLPDSIESHRKQDRFRTPRETTDLLPIYTTMAHDHPLKMGTLTEERDLDDANKNVNNTKQRRKTMNDQELLKLINTQQNDNADNDDDKQVSENDQDDVPTGHSGSD